MGSILSAKRAVPRPTEEKALSRIAREALRKGITQQQLLASFRVGYGHKGEDGTCHCAYCRRKRQREEQQHGGRKGGYLYA